MANIPRRGTPETSNPVRYVLEVIFGRLDKFRRLLQRYEASIGHFKALQYLGALILISTPGRPTSSTIFQLCSSASSLFKLCAYGEQSLQVESVQMPSLTRFARTSSLSASLRLTWPLRCTGSLWRRKDCFGRFWIQFNFSRTLEAQTCTCAWMLCMSC